jgi:hypothetical protein
MKTTSVLFALTILFSINCSAQNSKEGYFKTYDDYLKGNVKEAGEIDWIGRNITVGPFYVYFKGKQKKQKVKGNPNWGCAHAGMDYRFFEGQPYEIMASGKIMLYRWAGEKPNHIYYSLGNHTKLKRIIWVNESTGDALFADDKEILQTFKERMPNGLNAQNMNFTNMVTCIQKYNVRNK